MLGDFYTAPPQSKEGKQTLLNPIKMAIPSESDLDGE